MRTFVEWVIKEGHPSFLSKLTVTTPVNFQIKEMSLYHGNLLYGYRQVPFSPAHSNVRPSIQPPASHGARHYSV